MNWEAGGEQKWRIASGAVDGAWASMGAPDTERTSDPTHAWEAAFLGLADGLVVEGGGEGAAGGAPEGSLGGWLGRPSARPEAARSDGED